MKKITTLVDVAGISMDRWGTDGNKAAGVACRYAGVPTGGQLHVGTFVRRERDLDVAAAGARAADEAFRPMIDLPTNKQPWVPLCPNERYP